jgi:hypothetical protein
MPTPTVKMLISSDCYVPTPTGHQLLTADTEVDLNAGDAEALFTASRGRYVRFEDVPPHLRALGTRAMALETVRRAAADRRKQMAHRAAS